MAISDRIFGGFRNRFSGANRSVSSRSEPLIISRSSRVVSASRVPITPTDANNTTAISVSPTQNPTISIIPPATTQVVGDFVVDTRIVPFIKARRLFVEMSGLRPSINVNIFFDRVNVNAFCVPATISGQTGALVPANFAVNGAKGAQQVVDANGQLFFMFDIPEGTFFGGDRELVATDVADLGSISSASTEATIVYYGFNFTPRPQLIRPVPVPARTVTTRARPRRTTRRRDPLSQTFFVSDELTRGTEGMYASKVDIFFEKKSATLGVTVELREVVNGFPTDIVLPFSRKRLLPASVNISATAATPTTFVFDSPVFLSSGQEYALVVIPDGANPDYRVWTSEIGSTDVLDASDVTENWGEGTLFFSTNGSAWTPVQGEDLKFTLFRSKFSQASGDATFVNEDYEFMTLSALTGSALTGEQVFNSSSAVLTTAGTTGSVTSGSDILTGTGTNFTAELNVGDPIAVTKAADSIIRKVKSIESTTSLTMDGPSTFTGTGSDIRKATIGTIDFIDDDNLKLRLIESNAVAGSLFEVANVLKTEDGDTLTVLSIDDKTINNFQPHLPRQVLNGTTLSVDRSGVFRDASTFTNKLVELGARNDVLANEMVVKSKSNEAGVKSFKLKANVTIGNEPGGTTLRNTISPSIDITGVSLTAYANAINNDATNEFTDDAGNAISKYISKRVVLEDGMDAEDVNVVITGYRPFGTEILVFAKVINSLDPEDYDDKNWSLLDQTAGKTVFSDSGDLGDFREYTYAFASKPKTTKLVGFVNAVNASATINGSGTLLQTDLNVGDAVLILNDDLSNNYQVSRIKTITSETSIELEENIQFATNDSATIEKVEDPKTVFKNPQNSDIVRYFDGSGASYDSFKMYAVKIVMIAAKNFNVPKVKDLRVISLSV